MKKADPMGSAYLATRSIEAGTTVVMSGNLYKLKDFVAGGKVWRKQYVVLEQDALYITHHEQQVCLGSSFIALTLH